MNDDIIQVFEKELRNRIIQKMVPNQNEDIVLAKYFKHYDLNNTGYCKFRDFVKALEKVGVVLGKIVDIQHVFSHYDSERTGYIDYKRFSSDLFNRKAESRLKTLPSVIIENRNKNGYELNMMKDSHLIKLHNFIKSKGANGLIQFYKEFKLLDYNTSNRLGIDDFIKVVTETKIPLSSNEVQLLFHQYEKNNNSYFFYEELFKDMKSLYHNKYREKFIENFYLSLTEELGRLIKVNDIYSCYNPKSHLEFLENVTLDEVIDEFSQFMEAFKIVLKIKKDQILTKELVIEFFKFFGFGIDDDQTFYDLVTDVFNHSEENQNYIKKENNFMETVQPNNQKTYSEDRSRRNIKSEEIKFNNYENIDNNREVMQLRKELNPESIKESTKNLEDPIMNKFKKNLQSYGRKCLFSLIKHFKYYDNGTRFINKFDFAKVMKDFRLNLTITEIEKIFSSFSNKMEQLNYDEFIKTLSDHCINEDRKYLMQQIYEKLRRISDKKSVDLKIMKSVFNAKNHPTKRDESDLYSEYFECIEMFQYSHKNRKNSEISYEDFEEFNRLIAFLVDDDQTFKEILLSEWKNILNKNEERSRENSNQIDNRNRERSVKASNDEIINKDKSQHQTYSNQNERPTTPIRGENSVRSAIPIKKTLAAGNDKDTALVHNTYNKTKTTKPADPLNKLKDRLQRRGMRGLMNLHKQFMLNSSNINAISYGDFVRVLKLQRLEFTKEENQAIFDKFSHSETDSNAGDYNGQYLNFSSFVRNFKKVLSDIRIDCVEKAFTTLDIDCSEMLVVDDIKLKFNAASHPDVLRNLRSEDDIVVEFLDCFDLNYNFLAANENPNSSNLVSFEEFANFYEYVSFIYQNDEDFVKVVTGTWNF